MCRKKKMNLFRSKTSDISSKFWVGKVALFRFAKRYYWTNTKRLVSLIHTNSFLGEFMIPRILCRNWHFFCWHFTRIWYSPHLFLMPPVSRVPIGRSLCTTYVLPLEKLFFLTAIFSRHAKFHVRRICVRENDVPCRYFSVSRVNGSIARIN